MSDMDRDGALWIKNEAYGFKNLPPDGDQEAFIKSVLICAKGDGILAPEERNWLVGRAAAHHNSGYELAKTYDADEDLIEVLGKAPTVKKSGPRAIIYAAIRACAADGEFHPEEKAQVQKLAKYMGVEEDVVNQIEQQCNKEKEVREQRLALLFPDGIPY